MSRRLAAPGARAARAPALLSAALGAACGTVSSSYSFNASTQPAASSAPSASSAPRLVAPGYLPLPLDSSPQASSAMPTVGSASAAAIVQNNPLAAAALEAALVPYQRQYLSESKPVGGALGGMLSEGQAAQAQVPVRPGGCYAALAFSPSIALFTVELIGPGFDRPQARSEQGVARLGVAGCYQAREEGQAVQLRVTAVRGAGPVVARVYER